MKFIHIADVNLGAQQTAEESGVMCGQRRFTVPFTV
mgnify:CR=1 FL=1